MDATPQVGNRAMNPFGIAGDEEHTWEHLPEKSSGTGRTVPWCSGPWLSQACVAEKGIPQLQVTALTR